MVVRLVNHESWSARWPLHSYPELRSFRPRSLGDHHLCRELEHIYSRCFEDHLLHLQERAIMERVDQIRRIDPTGEITHGALRWAEEQIDHIRRHHRRQYDPPHLVGDWEVDQGWSDLAVGLPSSSDVRLTRSQIVNRAVDRIGEGPNMTATEVQARQDEWARRVVCLFDPLHEHQIAAIAHWAELANALLPSPIVGDPAAEQRGLDLLKQCLSPQQAQQYEQHKHFEVIGSDTGTRYRINHGRQMNIDELDEKGKKVCGWCFLPQGQLVAGDCMLAQKIALENDERKALEIANKIGGPTPAADAIAAARAQLYPGGITFVDRHPF